MFLLQQNQFVVAIKFARPFHKWTDVRYKRTPPALYSLCPFIIAGKTLQIASTIKTVMGRTTSAQIAERLMAESKALLKHIDLNISEISYSFGFEEPAHLSNFFRKHAQVMPAAWRG